MQIVNTVKTEEECLHLESVDLSETDEPVLEFDCTSEKLCSSGIGASRD